jgi:hypothetical protein
MRDRLWNARYFLALVLTSQFVMWRLRIWIRHYRAMLH